MSCFETAGSGQDTDRRGAFGFEIVGGTERWSFERGAVERKICMATCVDSSFLPCCWYWSMSATKALDLVARAAASAAQHGLGQLVQAELVHLAGEPNLGVGIEPQAEEPLGRVAGPLDVARARPRAAAPALHAAARSHCPSAGPHRPRRARRHSRAAAPRARPGQAAGPIRSAPASTTFVSSAIASSFSSSHHKSDDERQTRIDSRRAALRPRWPAGENGRSGRSRDHRACTVRRPCARPREPWRQNIR